jgi:hypothetical protein
MIVHIADTEKHKLTCFKRLNGDYVSESYGIFAAIFTVDNANSSVRIKGLYDALHMTTSAIGLSLLYLLSGYPTRIVALGYVSARLTRKPDMSGEPTYHSQSPRRCFGSEHAVNVLYKLKD